MNNVMGIINLNENEDYLREVTYHRPVAAIPFGGRYRLIDFVLSNMVNSGIQNIGILVKNKYRSLHDHLRSGKEWDLNRKRDGLFILPPPEQGFGTNGDLENFYRNLDYIRLSRQKYVVISGSNVVCNLNYGKALEFHERKGADITILYKSCDMRGEDTSRCTLLEVEDDGRIEDLEYHPARSTNRKVSMEMYIMEKGMLLQLVDACIARLTFDFVRDGLIRNLHKFKVYGYEHTGYVARIDSIHSYYRHSMDLLRQDVWKDLFLGAEDIYTKVKDEAPAVYKEAARVRNSMVANGCVIEGTVENSILFRAVKVGRGTCIRDSIIMQNGEICENAHIAHLICDKDVCITAGKHLKGEHNYPLVIKKGTVI